MSNGIKNNIKIIQQHSDSLKSAYYVRKIGIFGSLALAKGGHTKQSDVDILVDFFQPIGFLKFIELEDFLSKVLNKKVDLVTKRALKPVIKKEVLREVVYV